MNLIRLPPGYQRLSDVPAASAVAHERFADAIREILATQTLRAWATNHSEQRAIPGRAPVVSAPLPDGGPRVLVRPLQRAGWFALLAKDLYLPPTTAPIALALSWVLNRAGVPTPPVLAYATYRVASVVRRADLVTADPGGTQLTAAIEAAESADDRQLLLAALAQLFVALTDAGAWHRSLRAESIQLVARPDAGIQAVLTEIDGVQFAPPGDPNLLNANLTRLREAMESLRSGGRRALENADLEAIRELSAREESNRAATRALALEEYMP